MALLPFGSAPKKSQTWVYKLPIRDMVAGTLSAANNKLFAGTATSPASTGPIAYSNNGKTFTRINDSEQALGSPTAIAYSGSMYVMKESGSLYPRMLYSTDRSSWTSTPLPSLSSAYSEIIYDVIYANSQFVAVGGSSLGATGYGVAYTSPDGITWTRRTMPANLFRSIAYGAGVYVAVASTGTGNRVATSTDGITWTSQTSAADNTWLKVIFANSLFVAVGSSGTGNRVMTSPDGITWTSRTSAEDNTWNDVAWNGSVYCAVASTGTNRAMTSPDGVTWTARALGTGSTWQAIAWNGTTFLAVGNATVSTSATGTTWSNNSNMTANALDVIWDGTNFVAGGSQASNTSQEKKMRVSTDGITWSIERVRVSPIDVGFTRVAYNNGTYVALSRGPISTSTTEALDNVLRSSDGITWTRHSSGNNIAWTDLTFGNGLFVGVSQAAGVGNKIMTSSDGVTWSLIASVPDLTYTAVHWTGTQFVAVANAGGSSGQRYVYSADGVTWTLANAHPGTGTFEGIASNGTTIVLANGSNGILTSQDDGVTWQIGQTPTASLTVKAVAYGGGKFVAVGQLSTNSGCLLTSRDGILWGTDMSMSESSASLLSIAHFKGKFYVGRSGSNFGIMVEI